MERSKQNKSSMTDKANKYQLNLNLSSFFCMKMYMHIILIKIPIVFKIAFNLQAALSKLFFSTKNIYQSPKSMIHALPLIILNPSNFLYSELFTLSRYLILNVKPVSCELFYLFFFYFSSIKAKLLLLIVVDQIINCLQNGCFYFFYIS